MKKEFKGITVDLVSISETVKGMYYGMEPEVIAAVQDNIMGNLVAIANKLQELELWDEIYDIPEYTPQRKAGRLKRK